MNSITSKELLEHSEWLRGLAARLVADPQGADDLVQETWIQALRKAPSESGPLRPWLAKVLRNLQRNRWRAERRRADHEHLAGELYENSTPQELAQQAEGQRMIAEAVTKLDEPLRSVIVLHYFRGLTSEEIGRLRQMPSSTVRSQLKRGIEMLREHFDHEHGGREAWSALLLPVLKSPGKAMHTAASVAGVGLWLKVAALIVAAMGLSYLGLVATEDRDSEVSSGPEEVVKRHARATESSVVDSGSVGMTDSTDTPSPNSPTQSGQEVDVGSAQRTSADVVNLTPNSSSLALVQGEADEEAVVLRGRLLYPTDSPVVGHELQFSANVASDARQELYGLPDHWSPPQVITDSSGRFETSFLAPRAYAFSLRSKLEGYAADRWNWVELLPGSQLDLGTIALRKGGTIDGQLLRSDGSLVVGESWRIQAREQAAPSANGRCAIYHNVDLNEQTGRFRLEDLPPGSVRVEARSKLFGKTTGRTIQVKASTSTSVDLLHTGASPTARLVLLMRHSYSTFLAAPAPEKIRLLDDSVGNPIAKRLDGVPSAFYFDELLPGSYTIEIDDPRFELVRGEALPTGVPIEVQLQGSASLSLAVRDSSGQTVPIDGVRLECLDVLALEAGLPALEDASAGPRIRHLDADSELLDGEQLHGLIPGSYRLRVDGGVAGSSTVLVQNLAAGEERVVEVNLSNAGTSGVHGWVVDASGWPASSVEVLLVHSASESDSPASPVLGKGEMVWPDTKHRKLIASQATDNEGRFAFDHPGPGSFAVVAQDQSLKAGSDSFELTAGVGHGDLELRLPARASLQGHISGPLTSSTAGLRVLVAPASTDPKSMEFAVVLARGPRPLNADGSFEVLGLVSGPTTVFLFLPRAARAPGGDGSNFVTEVGLSGSSGDDDYVALPTFELSPGINTREFDIAEVFPSHAQVEVRVDGLLAPELLVQLGRSESFGQGGGRIGYTDSNGTAASIVDFPGSRWVEVQDRKKGWRYCEPVPLELSPGGSASTSVEIELREGHLSLIDEQGQAIAGAAVQVTLEEGGKSGWVGPLRTTDANGRLEMTLVPGEYRCYLIGLADSDQRTLTMARYSMFRPDHGLPDRPFSWGGEDVSVSF